MTMTRFLHITQQQAIHALFAILIGSGLLFGLVGLLQQQWSMIRIAGGGLLIDLALLLAYQRGWRYAPVTLTLLMTVFVNLVLQSSAASAQGLLWALLPVVLALILTDTVWTAIVATITLAIQLLGPGSGSIYREPEVLVGYLVITVGLLVSRLILEGALASASQSAERARHEADRATAALALAEQRADELAQRSATQQQLLDTITALETPAITLSDGVLLAPLVGYVDAPRAQRLVTYLVRTAHADHARHVILDITGVPQIEPAVVDTLIQLARALQLIGCSVSLSGIRADVAERLVHQQHTLAGINIVANLQQILAPSSGVAPARV